MKKSEIRERMNEITQKRRRELRPYYLSLGLTVGQGQPRILRCLLANEGPMTQRELADVCYLDPTTMSRTLDRLQEAGLLSRQPHPDSRRAWLVDLTDTGREKAVEICARLAQWDEKLLTGFTQDELDLVQDALQRMLQNLKTEDESE